MSKDAADCRKMTDSIPLCVKWGKETINMDFVVDSGVKGLKTELEETTGVPADRMKLMAKSKGAYLSTWKDPSSCLCLTLLSFLH